MAAQPFQDSRRPYAGIGQQVGSLAGGIIGQAIIPVPFLGAAAGAAIGGLLGGGAGSTIGPAPTVGRNFSSFGTFGGDGSLNWFNSGGDNGAGAVDADPFANWFGESLFDQAAAQGLQFNPNMAGAQIRVGGYDNFSRRGQTPGGYFYTPDTSGGSPENYALRPSDDFAADPFSAGQASAFTTNVLADLTARGLFTRPGEQQRGMDYWQSTQGTPLGFYGAPGGNWSANYYGDNGGGFGALINDRQNAVTGYINDQQFQRDMTTAGANTTYQYAPDQGWQLGAVDLSQPIWGGAETGLINPGAAGFPTVASAPQGWADPGAGYQGNG